MTHLPTTVLVADPDPMVRAGLRVMLASRQETIAVVAEASDGVDAVTEGSTERPDVVLLDAGISVLDAVEVTRRLRTHSPSSAVILLSTQRVLGGTVAEALAAGAVGFLLKDVSADALRHAVYIAAQGDSVVSGGLLHDLVTGGGAVAGSARGDTVRRLRGLTEKERCVATAVAEGYSNVVIARELHMSVSTVKTHVSRSLAKLRVENRVQLALMVNGAPDCLRRGDRVSV